jgi:hypothetical protein
VRNDLTSLQLKPNGGEVKMGTAVQLNLLALNKAGRADLIPGTMARWSSTDNQIGEVNGQGRLTPRKVGSVTITAAYAAHTATAIFTVTG